MAPDCAIGLSGVQILDAPLANRLAGDYGSVPCTNPVGNLGVRVASFDSCSEPAGESPMAGSENRILVICHARKVACACQTCKGSVRYVESKGGSPMSDANTETPPILVECPHCGQPINLTELATDSVEAES